MSCVRTRETIISHCVGLAPSLNACTSARKKRNCCTAIHSSTAVIAHGFWVHSPSIPWARALIGAWFKYVPLRFLGSDKMHDLQPIANIQKLSAGKANRKHEQQQFSVYYWSAQPRQDITSGLPYPAHNPQLARQHSRTDPP